MSEAGVIRHFTPTDLAHIIALEKRCFEQHTAYTPFQLKYLLTQAHSASLVESLDNTIRGFVIVLLRHGSPTAGVETLNVDPRYQGQGIGQKLLRSIEELLRLQGIQQLRLEVSTGNHAAIRLYERTGFQKIRFLANYYDHLHHQTHDAYQMIKKITT